MAEKYGHKESEFLYSVSFNADIDVGVRGNCCVDFSVRSFLENKFHGEQMTFKKAPANLYEESIQSGAWNALGEVKDLERRINKRLQSEEFGKQDIESRIITMKELKKEWKELFDRYSTKWDESAWASPKKRMWDMQKNMEARMKTAERMQKSPFHIASKWAKRHFFNDQSR